MTHDELVAARAFPAGGSIDDFITELTVARRDQGMTLAEVAARVGCSEATVSHWETGRYQPTGHYLAAWAGVLGYELDLHLLAPVPALPAETAALLTELIHTLAQLFKENDE